jgi:hypothetical protein
MKKVPLLLAVTLSAIFGCTNPSTDKQKELELKEKELALKEQELKLQERETTIQSRPLNHDSTNTTLKVKTGKLSNVENLIGYWFVPHVAIINIRFYRNGRFDFKDYNAILDKDENLQGTYQLDKGILTLFYNDRPKQKFKFYRSDKGDDNYYIKNNSHYFVKGENGYDN